MKTVRACARRSVGATFVGCLLLLLCAFAPAVLAAPPTHLHNAARDIGGFDHACGTAVDSEGDLYVASAGESKVRIFDPEHTELTSIENPNEPCGLAVDSQGRLYVSEQASGVSGVVVRYDPDAYPFAGTPEYGAPTTIDASGEAKGIAVDPFDDRLYVAKGARIDTYNPDGSLGIDEVQRVRCFECTGGFYRLSFGGQTTDPIPFNAGPPEVQAALEALSTIGAEGVSASETENKESNTNLVTFTGELAHTDVEALIGDCSECTGGAGRTVFIEERVKGFNGQIGEGALINATGVAAYTYRVSSTSADRYLFAADAASDEVKVFSSRNVGELKLGRTIAGIDHDEDPETPEQPFTFGEAGAYLTADPGNRDAEDKCAQIAEQACTAGHFFLYDDAHRRIEEFEASGRHLTGIELPEGFADAQPTAIALDRSGGAADGTIYVTSGPGLGAEVLAFGPLTAPTRPPREKDSFEQENIRSVAVDRFGTRYVAVDKTVFAYGPSGGQGSQIEIKGPGGEKGLPASGLIRELAADSLGNLYVLVEGTASEDDDEVVYFKPEEFPPKDGTKYSGPTTVATPADLPLESFWALAVNPANDHVFVAGSVVGGGKIIEFNAAEKDPPIVNPDFAGEISGEGLGNVEDIAVHGASGNVYVAGGNAGTVVLVIDGAGEEVLAQIRGAGSPLGPFDSGFSTGVKGIAVNQANGHVLVLQPRLPAAQEFEASGAFVARFGAFSESFARARIAIDNSGGSTDGRTYIALNDFDGPDLIAFGPLSYGEPPIAVTGIASGVGGGNATLHGTVDPRNFDLTDCRFEYLLDVQYGENLENEVLPFEGATPVPCGETLEEIGKGDEPAPVHADIEGLDPEGRYRFRLLAENKFGVCEKCKEEAGLFGPPLIITKPARPVSYTEAILRATIDPSGLVTKYRFEYGTSEAYGQSTAIFDLAPEAGPTDVAVPLFGLTEGTVYHLRLIAENEALGVEGEDQAFETLQRAEKPACPNAEYRTGRSANLPDCRAYELVTPADTGGLEPRAVSKAAFNNWLVRPRGAGAGESLVYFTDSATLPGFEGNGFHDAYRTTRGDGPHPEEGWTSEFFAPNPDPPVST